MIVSLSIHGRPAKKERGFYANMRILRQFLKRGLKNLACCRASAPRPGPLARPGNRGGKPPLKAPRRLSPALHALHDPLHLLELLQQPVDVLNLHARTSGNPPPARAVDDIGVAPLPRGHGIDDGDLAPHFLVALVSRASPAGSSSARELVHQGADAAHLRSCSSWDAQVRQVKALALTDLAGQPLGLLVVDLALHLLDQATTSPMPRIRVAMRSGSKGSSASVFSPTPRNTIGVAGDFAHRERRAAAGIAIGLGEDDARQRAPRRRRARLASASCPAMASTTNSRSVRTDGGVDAAAPQPSAAHRRAAGRRCRRCSTSNTPLPGLREGQACDAGSDRPPPQPGKYSALTCAASRSSCSIAAGRRTSVLTSSTRLRSRSMSQRASLAAVVVLPAPCSPASSTTSGGCARSAKPAALAAYERHQFPVQDADEGLPGAAGSRRLRRPGPAPCTASMKRLTTGSATSASSSAMRTSRSVAATFSSVMRPRPRRLLDRAAEPLGEVVEHAGQPILRCLPRWRADYRAAAAPISRAGAARSYAMGLIGAKHGGPDLDYCANSRFACSSC